MVRLRRFEGGIDVQKRRLNRRQSSITGDQPLHSGHAHLRASEVAPRGVVTTEVRDAVEAVFDQQWLYLIAWEKADERLAHFAAVPLTSPGTARSRSSSTPGGWS